MTLNTKNISIKIKLIGLFFLFLQIYCGPKGNLSEELLNAVIENNISKVETILKKGAPINAKTGVDRKVIKNDLEIIIHQGSTPLHIAILLSHIPIAKLLIENNADLTILSPDDLTPLSMASSKENFEIFKMLIEKNVDVNQKSKEGGTALMSAIYFVNLPAVKILIEKNADIDFQTENGWTPLLMASRWDNLEIAKFFLEKKVNVNAQIHCNNGKNNCSEKGQTALLFAIENGNLELVNLLLENGADPNLENKEGNPPLFIPLSTIYLKNSDEIIKTLLEHKANPNFIAKDVSKNPLLLLAIKRVPKDIVQMFLDFGAEVNSHNNLNETGLYIAVGEKNLDMCSLLIKYGADVNLAKFGKTPLMAAAHNGSENMVKFLLSNNADKTLKDKSGSTALDYAKLGKHQKIIEILE